MNSARNDGRGYGMNQEREKDYERDNNRRDHINKLYDTLAFEPRFRHVDRALFKLKSITTARTSQTTAFISTFAKTDAYRSLATPPPPPADYRPSIASTANVPGPLYEDPSIRRASAQFVLNPRLLRLHQPL
jgi:hypothetical protein